MANVNVAMGKKIKELRKEKELNQTDFGKLFHLSQNDVTNIENGKKTVSYEVLIDIANYFNVSTDYLIKENGIRTDNPTLQYICDYTGLNECALKKLRELSIADSDYDEFDKDYIIQVKQNQKAIANELLSSDVFSNLVIYIHQLLIVNNDALSYLSLFFSDFDYFKQLQKIGKCTDTELIQNAKYFVNEYQYDALHNALQDKIDLLVFNVQRSIVNYCEQIPNILYKIDNSDLDTITTFDWMRFVVFEAIEESLKNNNDISTYTKTIEGCYTDRFTDAISTLKKWYNEVKNNE